MKQLVEDSPKEKCNIIPSRTEFRRPLVDKFMLASCPSSAQQFRWADVEHSVHLVESQENGKQR